MASILTNNSAMVALQTLNSINKNMNEVQSQIATGKKVGNAKDNAAVFAISSVMKSDVTGFKAISESLSLGASTVAVGRQAAETVSELLTEIKGKIVSSQEDNVDRAKIQTDIESLRDQITSVVSTAQFNGKNLVNNFDSASILSSMDRDSSGNVESSSISFSGQDLTTSSGTLSTATGLDRVAFVDDAGAVTLASSAETVDNTAKQAEITIANDLLDTESLTVNFGDEQFTYTNNTGGNLTATQLGDIVSSGITNLGIEGVTTSAAAGVITVTSNNKFDSIAMDGSSTGATTFAVDPDAGGAQAALAAGATGTLAQRAQVVELGGLAQTGGAVSEGDGFRLTINSTNYDYVAKDGDTLNDVASGLKRVIDGANLANVEVKVNLSDDPALTSPTLMIDNDSATAVTISGDDGSGGTASGGLLGLEGIDVSTELGASNALDNIESLIQTSIDSAAAFGSVEGRIDIQKDFVGKLTDAFTSGIGSLVDADLEETSARLQALQVQQQLGTQALSIANQAPQSVLSLFR